MTTSTRLHGNKGLGLYGAGHFLIDGACALAVLSTLGGQNPAEFYRLAIGYNLLAFATQPLCGWVLDRLRRQRDGAIFGLLLVAGGCLLLPHALWPAIACLGLGNACYHAGAGAQVFAASAGHAGASGVFVAPGALGLLVGGLLGVSTWAAPYHAVPLLLLAVIVLRALPEVAVPPMAAALSPSGLRWQLLGLLLLAVACRSALGFSLPAAWKGAEHAPLLLAAMAFAGKSLGGIVADRRGWGAIGPLLFFLAVPAVLFQDTSLLLTALALLLIQGTTGVTLAATQHLFPGRPGFAFGLPCIALLAGAYPFLKPQPVALVPASLLAVICLVAGLASLAALRHFCKEETDVAHLR